MPDISATELCRICSRTTICRRSITRWTPLSGTFMRSISTLHYNPAAEAEAFVKEQIFPHLKEIISAYEKGTDFSIYMEDDGLIHAGSGLDQITWMDVRVGDWVATPRHGKPVEINALWYNALRIMESLCEKFDEDASAYRTRAEQVKESFNAKFWDSDQPVPCLMLWMVTSRTTISVQTRFTPYPFHFPCSRRNRKKQLSHLWKKSCLSAADFALSHRIIRTTMHLLRCSCKEGRRLPSGNCLGLFARWIFQCLYESEPPLLLCCRKCRPHVRACEKASVGFRLYRFHLRNL